jgi:hypothetical protein
MCGDVTALAANHLVSNGWWAAVGLCHFAIPSWFTLPFIDLKSYIIAHLRVIVHADYGSYMLAGYHPTLKIGVAIALNKDYAPRADKIDDVFCLVRLL